MEMLLANSRLWIELQDKQPGLFYKKIKRWKRKLYIQRGLEIHFMLWLYLDPDTNKLFVRNCNTRLELKYFVMAAQAYEADNLRYFI